MEKPVRTTDIAYQSKPLNTTQYQKPSQRGRTQPHRLHGEAEWIRWATSNERLPGPTSCVPADDRAGGAPCSPLNSTASGSSRGPVGERSARPAEPPSWRSAERSSPTTGRTNRTTSATRGANRDTEWHRGWQLEVPAQCREVVIGPHRADIVTPTAGAFVELQHSNLSVPEIREREDYYGRSMRWIWDCREAYDSGRLDLRQQDTAALRSGGSIRGNQLPSCRRPVLLHLGVELLHLQHMYVTGAVRRLGLRTDQPPNVVGLMNRGAGEEQLTLIP